MADNIKYYVVKQKALPEVLLKVAETNRIIETENISVAVATEKVGISRSSYYKYKDDIFPFRENVKVKKLKGFLWHHSFNTHEEHETKMTRYAHLFLKQKVAEGAEPSMIKQYLSPPFGFIKNYIFRLGFLDGMAGLKFALTEMRYTYKKYKLMNWYC